MDTHFDTSTKAAFENIVGKEEIARDEQFLLFPQCFSTQSDKCTIYVYIFDIKCISLFVAEFDRPKIGISGKGLIRRPRVQAALHRLGFLLEYPWARHFRAPAKYW